MHSRGIQIPVSKPTWLLASPAVADTTQPAPAADNLEPIMPFESYKNSRILVTGGAGFIGSHICERLLDAGAEVVSADNYFTGSRRNIAHLIANPLFEAVRHDVTFPLYIEVDAIFNLACPASPIHYQRDPVQTTKTSVHGAINMLGLAKRLKARIFQASTSEVYGDPLIHPQTEDYWGNVNPIGIRSCYDEGKRCAETLFFDYWRQHGLPIKVARIFNTYGPRMQPNDGRVVSSFIVQALKGEPISVFGDGGQTRSFCYVDDLVEAIMRLMLTNEDITGPINIGNNSEFTHPRTRREGHRAHGIALQAGVQAVAAGRSAPAPARSHQGEGRSELGAEGGARGRLEGDHRLFQALAGNGLSPLATPPRLQRACPP
ncbi:nucleoside-diphosphate-sugar epimerase [Bradyrhizobium huanghuaihaiense]